MNRLLPLLLLGCAPDPAPDTGAPAATPLTFCEGPTAARYDPLDPDELVAFPDDAWTVADETSPTGRRLHVTAETMPWSETLVAPLKPIVAELNARSGFGRLSGVVLRFTGPVDPGPKDAAASVADAGLQWLDLSTDPPTRIPYEVKVGEVGDQLLLEPLVTLRAGAAHAVVMTTAHTDLAGGCVAPAPLTRDRLAGASDDPALDARVAGAVEAAGVAPGDVSHVLVWTTHDDQGGVVAAARDAQSRDLDWETAPVCAGDGRRTCEGAFVSTDYREDGAVTDGTAQGTWTLPATIWLPADADGPVPVVVYGHGINGRRGHGSWLMGMVEHLGVAVVALDALHHGDHPTADPDADLPALPFLGLNLAEAELDARGLRGSFDQSALDRLQLLQLLRQHPDVDGDGAPDLDMDQLAYLGVSLGGLMGPSLMALDGDVRAGVLDVGGGKLTAFTTDTAVVAELRPVIDALIGPPDAFARMLQPFQSAVDPSDPAVWGAHVLEDRLDAALAPDLLFPVAMNDDTVPPSSAKALARGLGLPHLTPAPDPVDTLDEVAGPLSGNGPDGATVAYFQLDRVTRGDGVEAADHGNVPGSEEGRWMTVGFLESHLAGAAVIADPYAALGTPSLE